jgi:hypothetical protein
MKIEITNGVETPVTKFFSATPETDAFMTRIRGIDGDKHWVPADTAKRLERERDEAQKELSSIHRWIERNHPDGFIDSQTYWQNLERVTENWYDRLDRLEVDANRFVRERDEARQRASDLALGVKVADCMYDYGKYSVALREAKIKARYLQELTRAAYDEVEKLEDQEATQ